MELQTAARSSGPAGFTLVELMIVVAIASILLAVAIPSYMTYIRQSRRTEAKTAVLDLAGREERFLSTNPAAYTNAPGNLGYAALDVPIGNGYYSLSACVPAAAGCPNAPGGYVAPAAPSYWITASPVAGQSQAQDAQCTSFSVDSTGQQFATGDGTVNCWAN